ncbi:MAG: RHS repeat-associated core domain-containing protein [Lachnospiraceae bacterium]
MVSYTTGADTGEKLIQNLSGLEDNVIYAEQKEAGKDETTASYQDFLYTKDIQGSTSSILNKDTKGELSYEYDDFGETSIHGNSALKNEICYTGGIYDESTGLYYLNARYYDPENGRFLTEDTYRGEMKEPDTLHLYTYCKNNPINYVDPSGHKWRTFNEIKKKRSEKAYKCMQRYKTNKTNMESNKTYIVKRGYLYGQNYYSNIKFSNTNIAKMGCGIVAAHNAMYTCGRKALFVGLVTEFDYNLIIPGGMGIYWGTVAKCIRRHGFICDPYFNKEKFSDKITAKNPGILEADYKKKSGGHYIMIKKAGKKFRCYNVTGNVPAKAEDYNSIDAIMKKIGAKFNKGIIVRK